MKNHWLALISVAFLGCGIGVSVPGGGDPSNNGAVDAGGSETLLPAPTPGSGGGGVPPGDTPPTFGQRDETGTVPMTIAGQDVLLYPHPRIWMTKESLLEMKARMVGTNPMWVGLSDAVTKTLAAGTYQTTADSPTLFNLALAYKITDDSTYFTAAKKVLLNFTNPAMYDISCDGSTYCGNDNIDYGSIDLMYMAAAFDWLYNDLTALERQQFMDWVYADLIPFLRIHPYYGDPEHNLGHTKWCGEYLWSLATLNSDVRATALANSSLSFWMNQILPILDSALPGGHTYSGSGYGYNRVFKYALYGFEASYSALGLNMYASHSWPIDEAYYRIHATLPQEDLFASDWESAESTFNQGRMNENEAILAYRYRGTAPGKLAQYWLNHVFRPTAFYNQGGTRVNPIYVGTWMLWYDPTFTEENYTVTQPTAYKADGMGVFFSRSGWNDTTSTWMTLSASKYVGDHQLQNPGSIKIFKKEYLVVENGRMYSGQNSNVTPVDTNILFLGNGAVDYGNVTGGIYRRDIGSSASVSRFSASDSSYLGYARGDLSTSYDPDYFPLDYFHRSIAHLKEMPGSSFDYIVVHDRVRTTNAEGKKLYFHVVEPPTVAGNSATVVSPSNVSKVTLQNILTDTVTMSVEVIADQTAGGIPQEAIDSPRRIVLQKNGAAANEGQFLEVFAVTDQVATAAPTAVRVDSADSAWMGAMIPDAAKARLVLFAKTLSSPTTLTYTVTGPTSVQHSIYDLPVSTSFRVTITPVSGGRSVSIAPDAAGVFATDSAGVLIFSE